MTSTLDTIEAFEQLWREHGKAAPWFPSTPSLQEAAATAHMTFVQCERCRGAGYTQAVMTLSRKVMAVMIEHAPDEPVTFSIRYERCPVCDGAGGHIHDPRV